MDEREMRELMEDVAAVMRQYVSNQLSPILARLEGFAAEHQARLADLDARLVSVAELERRLADRLSTLKDGEPGPRGFGLDDFDTELIEDGRTLLLKFTRGDTTETHEIPLPCGKDADPDVIKQMVSEAVTELPVPAAPDIEAIVEAIKAGLPVPKDGESVDPADVQRMVDEAVAKIPAPQDGKSINPVEVAAMVKTEAERILAGWDKPQDGRSVTLDDVRPLIEESVEKAVSAIPAPEDGKSVTINDVRPLIDEEVARAVSEIPKPKDGEPGKLPIVKAWTDDVAYAGDVRSHGGSTWQAVRDTAKEPPHDDWICLARGGQDGRSPRVRETYDSDGDYDALDIVALNGAAFIARRDNPGPCPGEGWQIMAMQGKPGKPGPALKGDPGPPGPALRHLSIDANGVLLARNADGSEVECDLYPLLSRLG